MIFVLALQEETIISAGFVSGPLSCHNAAGATAKMLIHLITGVSSSKLFNVFDYESTCADKRVKMMYRMIHPSFKLQQMIRHPGNH